MCKAFDCGGYWHGWSFISSANSSNLFIEWFQFPMRKLDDKRVRAEAEAEAEAELVLVFGLVKLGSECLNCKIYIYIYPYKRDKIDVRERRYCTKINN